ncbi:unnamed protein product [Didymodactylos carnosus]|uniref:Uncharacterized protein n=1 Tax=Didymodactylos carnosus TaxID=1234261 RepID=A0A815QD04_9BILA|nr:unnamed protein product [Didymodactylos carnosus]CAF1460126.1 unnamed protein product [Didymodactylos carnosus]CAF4112780.1 unnamed protein product [Didymodactylos carnosus]CAF4330549.1 unnamed protein product [Didymodactylos carnosus]
MGSSHSKSCPAEDLLRRRKNDAISQKIKRGIASDFYFACRNGRIEYVQEKLKTMTVDEINKVEPNGSTALHAATFYNHVNIVSELFKVQCSRTVYNNHGNLPYDEIQTDEMRQLFERSSRTRFHEQNLDKSFEMFTPEQSQHRNYIQMFKPEKDVMEYITNRQTMVMWLKFFDWFSHKFSRFIDRTEALNEDGTEREGDYKASLFDLDADRDLDEFLKEVDAETYDENKNALRSAQTSESVVPLINLYTREGEFYKTSNERLALTITSDDTKNDLNGTSALCDRFVREFDMRQNELSQIAYTGVSYRGVTMKAEDLQ